MRNSEKVVLGAVGVGLGILLLSRVAEAKGVTKSAGDRTAASILFEGKGRPASVIIGFRILDKVGGQVAIVQRVESLSLGSEWQPFGSYSLELIWPSLPAGTYDAEVFVDSVARIYTDTYRS